MLLWLMNIDFAGGGVAGATVKRLPLMRVG